MMIPLRYNFCCEQNVPRFTKWQGGVPFYMPPPRGQELQCSCTVFTKLASNEGSSVHGPQPPGMHPLQLLQIM